MELPRKGNEKAKSGWCALRGTWKTEAVFQEQWETNSRGKTQLEWAS